LTELAARAAMQAFENRRTAGTQAASEAMAARATFDAVAAGELQYFAPVARMPGVPKALARTIHELRLAGWNEGLGKGRALDRPEMGRPEGRPLPIHAAVSDLECLLARVEIERTRSGIDDRAALFTTASDAWRSGRVPWAGLPLVLLDV